MARSTAATGEPRLTSPLTSSGGTRRGGYRPRVLGRILRLPPARHRPVGTTLRNRPQPRKHWRHVLCRESGPQLGNSPAMTRKRMTATCRRWRWPHHRQWMIGIPPSWSPRANQKATKLLQVHRHRRLRRAAHAASVQKSSRHAELATLPVSVHLPTVHSLVATLGPRRRAPSFGAARLLALPKGAQAMGSMTCLSGCRIVATYEGARGVGGQWRRTRRWTVTQEEVPV